MDIYGYGHLRVWTGCTQETGISKNRNPGRNGDIIICHYCVKYKYESYEVISRHQQLETAVSQSVSRARQVAARDTDASQVEEWIPSHWGREWKRPFFSPKTLNNLPYVMIFLDILWYFLIFYDISWYFMIFLDILWYFLIFYDILTSNSRFSLTYDENMAFVCVCWLNQGADDQVYREAFAACDQGHHGYLTWSEAGRDVAICIYLCGFWRDYRAVWSDMIRYYMSYIDVFCTSYVFFTNCISDFSSGPCRWSTSSWWSFAPWASCLQFGYVWMLCWPWDEAPRRQARVMSTSFTLALMRFGCSALDSCLEPSPWLEYGYDFGKSWVWFYALRLCLCCIAAGAHCAFKLGPMHATGRCCSSWFGLPKQRRMLSWLPEQ